MNLSPLSPNVKRILDRIETTIQTDVQNGVIYPSISSFKEMFEGLHIREDTKTKTQLEYFKAFRHTLEDGTYKNLKYFPFNMHYYILKIMEDIWAFYKPFSRKQIMEIENKVIISPELTRKLDEFLEAEPSDYIGNTLKTFLSIPYSSSWTKDDAGCGMRVFNFVDDLKTYNCIVKENDFRDITKNDNMESQIRIAFKRFPEELMIAHMQLENDFYRNFVWKYRNTEDYYKYKLWYGIVDTGIYYIYIP